MVAFILPSTFHTLLINKLNQPHTFFFVVTPYSRLVGKNKLIMCCICISEIVDIVEVVVLAATLITTICLYCREERRNRFYKLLDNWLHIKRNMVLEIEKVEGFDIITETIVGENIFHYTRKL